MNRTQNRILFLTGIATLAIYFLRKKDMNNNLNNRPNLGDQRVFHKGHNSYETHSWFYKKPSLSKQNLWLQNRPNPSRTKNFWTRPMGRLWIKESSQGNTASKNLSEQQRDFLEKQRLNNLLKRPVRRSENLNEYFNDRMKRNAIHHSSNKWNIQTNSIKAKIWNFLHKQISKIFW